MRNIHRTTCPETKETIDTIQAILAFIMAILGLKSAVPNKSQPTPSGSDINGIICCPVIKEKKDNAKIVARAIGTNENTKLSTTLFLGISPLDNFDT
ncbi:MAG: hypothetical protein CM1200mP3_07320 [Chloroflexota bacterium]|nr:MAG: hypothetical protein CM1200mP3_07320 [Chloroflexota bacterium]